MAKRSGVLPSLYTTIAAGLLVSDGKGGSEYRGEGRRGDEERKEREKERIPAAAILSEKEQLPRTTRATEPGTTAA